MEWFQNALATGAFDERHHPSEESSRASLDMDSSRVSQGLDEPGDSFHADSQMDIATSPKEIQVSSAALDPEASCNNSSNIAAVSWPQVGEQTIPDESHTASPAGRKPRSEISNAAPPSGSTPLSPIKTIQGRRPPRVVPLIAWALRYNSSFLTACLAGDIVSAQNLLKKGADINTHSNNDTALIGAVKRGDITFVRFLLENGASTESCNSIWQTPLRVAALAGNSTMVRILLDNGANIDATVSGETALTLAAKAGKEMTVHLLIERGANIEGGSGLDYTPLHAAVIEAHMSVVQQLLDHGADLEVRYEGKTPLMAALCHGRDEIAQILIERGSSIEGPRFSSTPLHLAVQTSCLGALNLLLNKGADIETEDGLDLTPLDYAVTLQSPAIARRLLDHGATIHQTALPANWRTLYHSVSANQRVVDGYSNMEKLLKEYPSAYRKRQMHQYHPLNWRDRR